MNWLAVLGVRGRRVVRNAADDYGDVGRGKGCR